eukprot:gene2685-34126_t
MFPDLFLRGAESSSGDSGPAEVPPHSLDLNETADRSIEEGMKPEGTTHAACGVGAGGGSARRSRQPAFAGTRLCRAPVQQQHWRKMLLLFALALCGGCGCGRIEAAIDVDKNPALATPGPPSAAASAATRGLPLLRNARQDVACTEIVLPRPCKRRDDCSWDFKTKLCSVATTTTTTAAAAAAATSVDAADEDCLNYRALGYCDPSSSFRGYMDMMCFGVCTGDGEDNLSTTTTTTTTMSECEHNKALGYCDATSTFYTGYCSLTDSFRAFVNQNCNNACDTLDEEANLGETMATVATTITETSTTFTSTTATTSSTTTTTVGDPCDPAHINAAHCQIESPYRPYVDVFCPDLCTGYVQITTETSSTFTSTTATSTTSTTTVGDPCDPAHIDAAHCQMESPYRPYVDVFCPDLCTGYVQITTTPPDEQAIDRVFLTTTEPQSSTSEGGGPVEITDHCALNSPYRPYVDVFCPDLCQAYDAALTTTSTGSTATSTSMTTSTTSATTTTTTTTTTRPASTTTVGTQTSCALVGCNAEWHVSHTCGCDDSCIILDDCCTDYEASCVGGNGEPQTTSTTAASSTAPQFDCVLDKFVLHSRGVRGNLEYRILKRRNDVATAEDCAILCNDGFGYECHSFSYSESNSFCQLFTASVVNSDTTMAVE